MTNENRVLMLEARKALLVKRNPVENAKIVRKLERLIRKYSK